MEVQCDGLALDEELAVVPVGQAAVRLHGHVGLTADVELVFDHLGRLFENRLGFSAFGKFLDKENVWRTRVDFDGILSHG